MNEERLARLAEFAAYHVRHPHLATADQGVLDVIEDRGDTVLVFLFGPTGVGKSTLLARVRRVLIERASERMAREPDHVPIVPIVAETPERGPFSWTDLYRAGLEALDEPGIDWKVDPDRAARRAVGRPRATASDLRRALASVIAARHVPVVTIDDAQHIGIVGSGRRLVDQLDHLKSFADASGALFVLAGTYELLRFRNLSDQLGRRSADVHLSRYGPSGREREAFDAIVDHLVERLPLPITLSVHVRDELYAGSLGCVGPLKGWLYRAARAAINADAPRVTATHLRSSAIGGGARRTMAQAIADGESSLAEEERELARSRELLGMTAAAPATTTTARPAPPARHGRRGQRGPRRDPVGEPGGNDLGA